MYFTKRLFKQFLIVVVLIFVSSSTNMVCAQDNSSKLKDDLQDIRNLLNNKLIPDQKELLGLTKTIQEELNEHDSDRQRTTLLAVSGWAIAFVQFFAGIKLKQNFESQQQNLEQDFELQKQEFQKSFESQQQNLEQKFESEQRTWELLLESLRWFEGHTQRRSIGIALVESKWEKHEEFRERWSSILVNQAIYLLTRTKHREDRHERANLYRIMNLLIEKVKPSRCITKLESELLTKELQDYNPKSNRGLLDLDNEKLEYWKEKLAQDKTSDPKEKPECDKWK